VAISHTVSPWQCDPKSFRTGEKTKDFASWCTDGEMPPAEAEVQFKRWKLRNNKK